MPRKTKNKMYIVYSKINNYRHGVFPFTKQGKIDAQNMVKNSKKEKLYIEEK
jgi:hypothetical protein|tara:strand:+ start:18202 stop:18357 length:156 start_codon:yes stop_codon:yes gene_type:complete